MDTSHGRENPEFYEESIFSKLTPEQLKAHMDRAVYGDFLLTDAVRPSYDLKVVPKTGFKCELMQEEREGQVPVIVISASGEILFRLFLDIISLLHGKVVVRLCLTHGGVPMSSTGKWLSCREFLRHKIDFAELKRILLGFENFLLDDGRTSIAISNYDEIDRVEIQFDEHKIIRVCNWPAISDELSMILKKYRIPQDPKMEFIDSVEHVQQISENSEEKLEELVDAIGAEEQL